MFFLCIIIIKIYFIVAVSCDILLYFPFTNKTLNEGLFVKSSDS